MFNLNRAFFSILIVFFITSIFGQKATFHLRNGQNFTSKILSIQSTDEQGNDKMKALSITAAQGIKELRLTFDKIKSITLKSSGDISCFEDSRFSPIRKFCTKKYTYLIKLKKKSKSKKPLEIVDDRWFIFTLNNKMDPLKLFFYKIKLSNEGKEKKIGYKDLEKKIREIEKTGVKKIIFK